MPQAEPPSDFEESRSVSNLALEGTTSSHAVNDSGEIPVLAPDPSLNPHHSSSGVPIRCQFCAGQRFRRSRLRFADIKQLLLLTYPVRCLFCSQRQMVSFTVAGVSLPSHVRQPKKKKQRGSSAKV